MVTTHKRTDRVHTVEDARFRGFITQVLIEGDYETHEGLVRVDEDLDSIFRFYSLDDGRFMTCHGYNCTINTLED